MSTVSEPLKYLWSALYKDGHQIDQPEDDTYSKHDPKADHNPSAFRDVLEYTKSPLQLFWLRGERNIYIVNLEVGRFTMLHANAIPNEVDPVDLEDTPLSDRKLIFFRQVQQQAIGGVVQPPRIARYCIGYEGKNLEGKVEKKVIYIDG